MPLLFHRPTIVDFLDVRVARSMQDSMERDRGKHGHDGKGTVVGGEMTSSAKRHSKIRKRSKRCVNTFTVVLSGCLTTRLTPRPYHTTALICVPVKIRSVLGLRSLQALILSDEICKVTEGS